MYKAVVTVTLRKSILDPEGKAIEQALQANITKDVSNVRVGKEIELMFDVSDKAEAERLVDEACKKILANPVMEDYTFRVEEAG